MNKKNIDGLFKKSFFAHFLELSRPHPLRFPMIMVYGLLKHWIMYVGDDRGPKEGGNKMDEVWINYCDMPVCFGLKEFAILTGLRCDRPEETAIKKTPHKGSNKCKVKKDGLLGIVGPSYKVKDLIADLKNKDIPKHYIEKLCLVWFFHSVLLARDVKKVIEHDLLALADNFGRFNDYPWGYDNYYLTIKYLLKERKPKTTTLYGFPWVFIAWVCEAIPPLQKHFTDYSDKVSHPRILRWLAAVESDKKIINEADIFNPPDDIVVHPWIVPTIDELWMTFFLALGLVDTKEDPTVELIKKELDGSTSIRRALRQGQSNVEPLHDLTQTATNSGASSGGVAGEVVCDGGSHPTSASATSRDYEHIVYKYREDKLLDKLEAIAEATEELKSKRGVIPSNEVREPCTPTVEGPPKKVDIFTAFGKEKKKELEEFIKMKVQKEYTMHSFAAKDFSNMTNMRVWYEDKYVDENLCRMRGRQLAYPDAYDTANRIMDLNFYNNFKDRYVDLRNLADSGSLGFDQLVSTFQWDEEVIKYVIGKRLYPQGKSWTKAKKILVVMNVDVIHFLTVEILLYEGKIKVYDCNLPVFSEKMFLTYMQPLLKLLTQSKLMDHLPAEVLVNESWVFEGRNKNIQLPKI
ncbi:hypothetical protein P3L10_032131 [Capsicum annuum]